MKKKMAMIIGAALLTASSAGASTLSWTFDSGKQGWSRFGGSIAHDAGGYLTTGDIPRKYMGVRIGRRHLGDFSEFAGGTFSFDAAMLAKSDKSRDSALFGRVIIFGGGTKMVADVFDGPLSSAWTTGSIALDAASWGVSETKLARIMSDVRGVKIFTEAWNDASEVVGIDNITFASAAPSLEFEIAIDEEDDDGEGGGPGVVPLPAGGMLLLSGLGALAIARRRKKA